jgi:ABC-type transport system substrate-binding protein
VRFSNGDTLDASSVKYTLDRIHDPATHAVAASALNAVQAVNVVDRYTVRLVMSAPFRPILTALANPGGSSIVERKAVEQEGDKFCQYPVSSGAFMVKSVGPGFSTITLARSPYHIWERPDAHNRGRAYLSSFVMKYIPDPAAEVSELLIGVYYLGFNTSHPPFNKLAVRKAIAEAIDRKAGIKVSLGGLGVPAYSPVPVTVPFYDKHSKSYAIQYNPKDARRILAANHVTGPYTLMTPSYQAAAEFVQAELAQAGVKVNIVTGDYSTQLKGQFDLNMTRTGMVDPDQLYTLFHSSQTPANGDQNVTFYHSATLDNLLVKGRETLNTGKARTINAEAQRYIDTHVVMDPLWTDVTMMGVRARVHGWHTGILGFNPLAQDLYVRG